MREDNSIYWEYPGLLIKSVLNLYLDRIEFYLTGSTMIWCDAQQKDDCQISLPGFWLYFPYALSYRLFETFQYVCWNLVLQKDALSFIWIHFQPIFIFYISFINMIEMIW